MKKLISLSLALVLCLGLCACGANSENDPETEQTETTTEPVIKLSLGDTASTDIAEFTLLNADFAVFASATQNSTYLMPTDENTVYGASVGKILMIPTFTVTNKDRAGSLNITNADWPLNWVVRYGDNEYPVYGFDLNYENQPIRLDPGCRIDPLTEYNIAKQDTSNMLLSAGQTASLRIVTVVNFEPADMGDAFELVVSLPTSSGQFEEFIYAVADADEPMTEQQTATLYGKVQQLMELEKYYPALNYLEQLGDYKDSKELYDFCMRRYAVQVGMYDMAEAYLKENMDSFRQLTGEELGEMIPGKSWYVQGVGGNAWDFLEDGKIDDKWGNDRGWSVEDDSLVIRTKQNEKKVAVLEIYDGGYVLLENGQYYATFYEVEE